MTGQCPIPESMPFSDGKARAARNRASGARIPCPAGDVPRAAAGQLPPAAGPGQQAAPALAAAVRDLYIAVRALPGTLPGGPGHGVPGAVPEKIRQAAESIGAAWQCLAGEPVPRARRP